MKIVWLTVLCGLWCVRGRGARGAGAWPECARGAGAACAADRDDWASTRNYVVNGALVSASKLSAAVRWRCARAAVLLGQHAPRFRHQYTTQKVELLDCEISPNTSYSMLLKGLLRNLYFKNITLSLNSTRALNARWPSTDNMKQIKIQNLNNPKLVERQTEDGLRHLILRGAPISGVQLASAQAVETWSGADGAAVGYGFELFKESTSAGGFDFGGSIIAWILRNVYKHFSLGLQNKDTLSGRS